MTAQLSRERLEEIKEFGLARIIKPISDYEVLALVNIALAGMDSEPVAYIIQDKTDRKEGRRGDLSFKSVDQYDAQDINEHELTGTPLYAAPPAPVAVPECFERLLRHAYGISMGTDWNKGTAACHHREALCRAVDDCRATMLKAGPVTGWIKCSERMPEEGGRYWCYVEEQNSLGKSHYQWNCSWNGDEWSDKALTGRVTHWMPLPAAPEQEV